jgi:hypothetical protein
LFVVFFFFSFAFEFEFFFSSSSFVVAFVAFVVATVVEGTTPFGGTNSWAEGVNGMCATSNTAFECVPPSDEARALKILIFVVQYYLGY